jgi:hypothetical protein
MAPLGMRGIRRRSVAICLSRKVKPVASENEVHQTHPDQGAAVNAGAGFRGFGISAWG